MAFPVINTWLDWLLFGYNIVASNNAAMPKRGALNFVGLGVTVADNEANGSTDVTISAATPKIIDVTRAPYLAVGDGVTDVTARIQSALNDAAATSPPARVYIPAAPFASHSTPNFYNVAGTITLPATNTALEIFGDEAGTHLKGPGTVTMFDGSVNNPNALSMKNLILEGATAGEGIQGVNISGTQFVRFEKVTWKKFGIGLGIYGATISVLGQCQAFKNTIGVQIDGGHVDIRAINAGSNTSKALDLGSTTATFGTVTGLIGGNGIGVAAGAHVAGLSVLGGQCKSNTTDIDYDTSATGCDHTTSGATTVNDPGAGNHPFART